jgi:hypothetical protein
VHLTSNQTKQKIADFKMNNISITVSFSPDGLTMFTGGGGNYSHSPFLCPIASRHPLTHVSCRVVLCDG